MARLRARNLAARGAVILVALLGESGSTRARQGTLEQIVVKVNGDVITKTEIDERLRVTRSLAGEAVQPSPAAGRTDPASEGDLLPRILSDTIDELLMQQRAAELGLEVTEHDVDEVLASIKAQSNVTTDPEFEELLRREGIALSALRETTRRQVLIERVRQQLYRRVSVSDAEASRYYEDNRTVLMRAASVTFREIRIVVPPENHVPQTDRDRALVKVVAAGDRLAAGAAFADVARTYSESPSKAADGLVGPIDAGTLEPSVRSALAAMRPGDISMPVRTAEGYCFLKLEGSTGPRAPTFQETRDDIMQRLLGEKRRVALEDLLNRLRSSAILQWKRPDFERAYDRRPRYR